MKETLVIGTNVICVTFCDRERNSRIHLWRVPLRKQPLQCTSSGKFLSFSSPRVDIRSKTTTKTRMMFLEIEQNIPKISAQRKIYPTSYTFKSPRA